MENRCELRKAEIEDDSNRPIPPSGGDRVAGRRRLPRGTALCGGGRAGRTGRAGLLGSGRSCPPPCGQGLWATARCGIGPFALGDPCRIEPAVDPDLTRGAFDGLGKYLSWDGETLWFTTGREVVGVG